MAVDWNKIKLDYINGNMSLRTLADSHKIKAAGVMARAAKEKWEDERKQISAEISKKAGEVIASTRADQLSIFNADDLKVAKAIRGKAASMLQGVNSPQDLRALASTFESAQKMGRLALGASTNSSDINTPNPILIEHISPKALSEAVLNVRDKF